MYKIYENIRKLRESHGWTQTYLAQKLGYADKTAISKIERGKILLSTPKIEEFAEIFGVTPGELMGDPEETVTMELNPQERAVVIAYRMNPNMQEAVNRLLGIEVEKREESYTSRKEA